MSFWTYLPLIKTGIAVIVCSSQCMGKKKKEDGEVSFWDWLSCVGGCILDHADDIPIPEKPKAKKKTSKVAVKQQS